MAVQWDKENGLNGWAVDFGNTIRGIKKDLPEVDEQIKKFIEKQVELLGDTDSEHIEILRPGIIQDAEELSNATDELRDDFTDFLRTADLSGNIMEQYQTHLANSANQTSRFSSFTAKAGNLIKSFGAGLASMGVNMLIGDIIGLSAEFFTALEEKEERAAQNAAGFTNSIRQMQASFSEGSTKIEELSARYDELSKGVSNMGDNISLTDEQYTEYKNTVSELSDLMPNLNTLFDEQGKKIGFVGGKLDDANKKYQKYIQRQAQIFLREGDEDGNTFQDTLDDFKYSNETDTYGWSNGWRDAVGSFLQGITFYDEINKKSGNGQINWGSELFGAEAEYSTKEQLQLLEKLVNTSKEEWSGILNDSHLGDSKDANLVEELLGIDVDEVAGLHADEYNQLQQSLLQKITDLKQTQQEKAVQITSGMQSMLISDDDYWTMDENARNRISSMLSGLNYDALTDLDIDLGSQLSIETWVAGLIDDIKSNKNGISDAVRGLFELDTDTLSPSEAKEYADKYINTIANAMYNGSASDEQIDNIKKSLGFDSVDQNYTDFQNKLNSLNEKKADFVVSYLDSDGKMQSSKQAVYDNKRTQELTNWADKIKVTQEELGKIKEEGYDGQTSVAELTSALDRLRNDTPENMDIIAFPKIWDSLGNETNEEQARTSEEAKEKLLALAEAGKLTAKELENSPIAQTIFDQTGLSAEQAAQKVNELVDNVRQLNSMKTGITAITSAYDEKKNSNHHTVSSATLNSMYDTLGVENWDAANKKVWENYKKYAADSNKSMADTKKAQDKLASSYVNSNNFLANLDETNQDYYRTILSEMGVTNAAAIVTNELTKKKALAAIETEDLTNKSSSEISALIQEKGETDAARNAMKLFVLEKMNANGKTFDTTEDINQLINLMESLGLTTDAIQTYRDFLADTNPNAMDAQIGAFHKHNAEKEYNKIIKSLTKKARGMTGEITTSDGSQTKDPSDSSTNSNKNKTKETKTEIDWLSRRLTRMQSILDLTASRLQNLFSVKAKNTNLNKQIEQTTALMEQYGIAANMYEEKANSIAKGSTKKIKSGKNKGKTKKVKPLSKDIIRKVQSGKITKSSYKELVKKYGKEDADRINKYIDYYDKANDARKNKQEQKTKVKDLEKQQLQIYVDEYNAGAALAEINSDNAIGYKSQNEYINTQLSWLEKSYQKQIEIAGLSKDKTEQDRLQAELEAKKVELKQKQIENLKTDYKNRIDLINNGEPGHDGKQDLSNALAEIEARGDIIQAGYYSSLNSYENSILDTLKEELGELQAEQKTFTENSQEWYDLQSDIQSVENSISEARISIIENNKKIGALRQTMYDEIASRNSDAGSEAQFLASLLGDRLTDDKTGALTKEGLGVLGSYGIELEANTNTALSYKEDREEIEKAIAAYTSGDAHALDIYGGSLKSAEDALDEVIKKQQDAISADYNSEKKIYDLMVKRYESQLVYMKSIIDAKKQVLSMEKDLYDYEKNISKQTKNIASLEKQLAAIRGDDSEEGRAKAAKLLVSLDEANQELQDTEYDRYISDQQNMLDNMYTQYQDLLTALEGDFEAVVQEGLNLIATNASGISETLKEYGDMYGYNPSTDMQNILEILGSEGMKDAENALIKTLPDTITTGLSNLGTVFQNAANKTVTDYGGNSSVTNNANVSPENDKAAQEHYQSRSQSAEYGEKQRAQKSDLKTFLQSLSGKNNTSKPLKPAEKGKTYKSKLNQILSQYGYVVKSGTGSSGVKYINMFALALGLQSGDGSFKENGVVYKTLSKKYPYVGFRNGGIVRTSNAPNDGDYVKVRVNPDETILTQNFTKMLPDTVDTMERFIQSTDQTPLIRQGTAGNNQNISIDSINLDLPNVTDYRSFREEMQKDSTSRRMMECIISDCATKGRITNNIQMY